MNEKISGIWGRISGRLLPFLERVLPPMQEHHRKVAMILEFVRPEDIVRQRWAATGRPPVDLSLMARAFVAKMELNLDTTKRLIETLKSDEVLRRIVGFPGKVPSNATFSRAFHEFSRTNLAGQIHEALKSRVLEPGAIVIDSSLDATAIEGREKAAKKTAPASSPSAPEKERQDREGKNTASSLLRTSRPPSIGRPPKTVIGAASETARARPNIGRDSSSIFWWRRERSTFRLS